MEFFHFEGLNHVKTSVCWYVIYLCEWLLQVFGLLGSPYVLEQDLHFLVALETSSCWYPLNKAIIHSIMQSIVAFFPLSSILQHLYFPCICFVLSWHFHLLLFLLQVLFLLSPWIPHSKMSYFPTEFNNVMIYCNISFIVLYSTLNNFLHLTFLLYSLYIIKSNNGSWDIPSTTSILVKTFP